MASVSELEEQQRRLRGDINRLRSEAYEAVMRQEERFSQKYGELSRQARETIEEDRRNTDSRYREELSKTVSAAEERSAQLLKKAQEEYRRISAELETEIAKERAAALETKRHQQEFEREIREDIERQRGFAEEALVRVSEMLRSFAREIPVDWFRPGSMDEYRKRAAFAKELLDAGQYQASTAVSNNLELSLGLDDTDILNRLKKWCRSFNNARSVIAGEHTFICTDSLDLSGVELSADFFAEENISDLRLTEEMLRWWADDELFRLKLSHEADYDFLSALTADMNAAIGQEELSPADIMKMMCRRPELSETYPAEKLYETGRAAEARAEKLERLVSAMRSRIKAYDQRREIYSAVYELMENEGFEENDVYYIDDDPRSALIGVFGDPGGVIAAEVQIVPEMCVGNGQWYNSVGWSVASDIDTAEFERRLRIRMKDALEEFGVMTYPFEKEMAERSVQDRTRALKGELSQRLNGTQLQ